MTKIKFKTLYYNETLDLLITPILMDGRFFYEYKNTGAYRVITDMTQWTYIDFI